MKRIDQKKVEARLTGMIAQQQEPVDMTDAKRRAREEFFRRDELLLRRLERCKSLLKRTGIAVAAAAGLLVLSFVYTIFAPVTVSNANNFVRRTTLWVNDTLHLGIEFPVPIDDENTADLVADGEVVFDSVEAASKAIGLPLVHLSEESGAELVEVVVYMRDAQYNKITAFYTYREQKLIITSRPLQSENTIVVKQATEDTIQTALGEIFLWPTATGIRGHAIEGKHVIEIKTGLEMNEAKKILRYMRVIN